MQIGDEAEGFILAFDLGAVDEVHLGQVGAGGDESGDDRVAHVVFGIEPYDAALRCLSFLERKFLVCCCHGRKEGGDLALALSGKPAISPIFPSANLPGQNQSIPAMSLSAARLVSSAS